MLLNQEAVLVFGSFVIMIFNLTFKGSILEVKVLDMLVAHSDSSIVPLSKSTPDVETPSLKPLWRELSRVVQHNLQTVLGYDLLAGQRVLREQIARLMLDSGSVVTADDIIITSGCHNSMSLALMAVCKPGDIVAVVVISATGVAAKALNAKYAIRAPPTIKAVP